MRLLADTFREKKIPADVIWLDIHYHADYMPFTWNNERFPDPKKMISDLRAKIFALCAFLTPIRKRKKVTRLTIKAWPGNYFVKNPDGSVFEGPVWPSNAEEIPVRAFFRISAIPPRANGGAGLYESLLNVGVAGIWNDMNEPSVFNRVNGTMPDDVIFNNEGQPADELRNSQRYGQLMTRSTFEGLSRLQPDKRAFVLTRSTFAGGQRYAALWTGDAATDWPSLRQSVSTLLGLGISGFPFVGGDIGGFGQMPSAELFTRWLQTAYFIRSCGCIRRLTRRIRSHGRLDGSMKRLISTPSSCVTNYCPTFTM